MKSAFLTFLLIVFFVPLSLGQKTYYVSAGGNDLADGITKNTPWKTLGKVNTTTFVPGDSIMFRRGDVWRDQLVVHNSGSSSKYITYGAYGSGPNPKILGSIQATGFTNTAYTNIWQSTAAVPVDPWAISYFGEVFFEELSGKVSWGSRKSYTSSLSNLTKEYDWTWNGNRIYVYATSDPDTRYSSVEAPQEAYNIQLEDHNYIDINHIDMHYTSNACIYDEYATVFLTGLRVTYCNIGWVGTKDSPCAYGLDVHHSNSYYAYNEIHDCGRRNISLTMYDTDPITQTNVLIEHNYFHHGFHTTGVDCNNAGNHVLEKITIRNNVFEGDPTQDFTGDNTTSNHVFIANQSPATGITRNVYVYNNLFTYAHGKAIIFEDIDTAYAAYNTIYGFNLNLDMWQPLISTEYGANIHIINNIIYHNGNEDVNGSLIGYFNNYSRTAVPAEIDYNLWYATDSRASLLIFYQPYPSGYEDNYNMAAWSLLRSDYPGYEAHGPNPADPQFNNPTGGDFTLKATSPAIGRAKPLTWITTDYMGNPRSNVNPTIGAFEYNSGSNIFPTVSLTSPSNGATFTAPASVTLTATAADSDGSVTKVEFYNGTTKIGEKTSAPYTYTWTNVPAGTYSLSAIAVDNLSAMTKSAVVGITVSSGTSNVLPSVVIMTPGNWSYYTAPATISVSANASDADGTITKVEFYNGTNKIGERTAAPFYITLTNVAVGTYVFTAVATDNSNGKTTSAAVTVHVTTGTTPVNNPPIISITSPATGASFTAPATVTIAVNVSDLDGTISKVEFYNSAFKIGETTTTPFTFDWNDVPAGSYTIIAVATDNLNATASSAPVDIDILNPDGDISELDIYPNPTAGIIYIGLNMDFEGESCVLTIVNFLGVRFFEGTLLKEEGIKQYDFSFFPRGTYIAIIKDARGIITTRKFVKN